MNLELFKKKGAEEKRQAKEKRDVDLGFKNTEATGRQKRWSTEKNVDVTKFNMKRAAAMKTWRLKKADTI